MRLLLTRPELDAQRTAKMLRAQGHEVIAAPLLHIEPIREAAIGDKPWAAILIASANAAHALTSHPRAAHLRTLPVLTVGRRTAEVTEAAGFADVTSAHSNVGDLARLVAQKLKPPALLLYLAGEDRVGDLAGDLRAQGFAVDMTIVYRAVAATSLPRVAADALAGGVHGVLHYSRRTAGAYVDTARAAGLLVSALKPVHFCLSARVAEPLAQAGATDIRIAPNSEETALIALIGAV